MTTTPIATDDQIRALRARAVTAGDAAQVRFCTMALEGDVAARIECTRVIHEARMRAEDDNASRR